MKKGDQVQRSNEKQVTMQKKRNNYQ